MASKGMSFTGWCVRALLAGRKTETRRIIRWPAEADSLPAGYDLYVHPRNDGRFELGCADGEGGGWTLGTVSPPHQPGDLVYVKEALGRLRGDITACTGDAAVYKTDNRLVTVVQPDPLELGQIMLCELVWRWKRDTLPARFMPREAARIWLRIRDVRVERVQDITDAGALAEGLVFSPDWIIGCGLDDKPVRGGWGVADGTDCCYPTGDYAFGVAFNRLHGEGTMEANPWVWVYSLERAEAPL